MFDQAKTDFRYSIIAFFVLFHAKVKIKKLYNLLMSTTLVCRVFDTSAINTI